MVPGTVGKGGEPKPACRQECPSLIDLNNLLMNSLPAILCTDGLLTILMRCNRCHTVELRKERNPRIRISVSPSKRKATARDDSVYGFSGFSSSDYPGNSPERCS